MNSNKITIVLRISIIIIALCGAVMCAFWYPFSISLTAIGVTNATPTLEQIIKFWVQLVFYWLVSIPCFFILALLWYMSVIFKKEGFFSEKIIKATKIEIITLLIDLAIFLIGNIVFAILGWNDFAIIYYLITVIGLVVVGLFYVFIYIIKKGIQMKEEIEGTI